MPNNLLIISQEDNMTRYIIMTLTALLLISCNDKGIVDIPNNSTSKGLDNSAADTKVYTKTIKSSVKRTNIPKECYDTNGNFDSNRGHDSLDCDNL